MVQEDTRVVAARNLGCEFQAQRQPNELKAAFMDAVEKWLSPRPCNVSPLRLCLAC